MAVMVCSVLEEAGMSAETKPLTPITMSAELEAYYRRLMAHGDCGKLATDGWAELDAIRALLAETQERLMEVSQKWLNAASRVDELLPIKAERDSLRERLAQAQRDTERMDWLEREREWEQEYLDNKREWSGPCIFRQNVLITRKLIDTAMEASTKALCAKPDQCGVISRFELERGAIQHPCDLPVGHKGDHRANGERWGDALRPAESEASDATRDDECKCPCHSGGKCERYPTCCCVPGGEGTTKEKA